MEMLIHLFRWDIAVIFQKLSESTDIVWKIHRVVPSLPFEGSGSRSILRHLDDNGSIIGVDNSWISSTGPLSEMR